MNFAIFVKSSLLFNGFYCLFCLQTQLYSSVINAKTSVFVICAEAIVYLLLHNLHHFTFKKNVERVSKVLKCSKHHNIWFQMKEHLNIQCSLFKYLVSLLFYVSFWLSDTSKSKTQTFYSVFFVVVLNVILKLSRTFGSIRYHLWMRLKAFLLRWIASI